MFKTVKMGINCLTHKKTPERRLSFGVCPVITLQVPLAICGQLPSGQSALSSSFESAENGQWRIPSKLLLKGVKNFRLTPIICQGINWIHEAYLYLTSKLTSWSLTSRHTCLASYQVCATPIFTEVRSHTRKYILELLHMWAWLKGISKVTSLNQSTFFASFSFVFDGPSLLHSFWSEWGWRSPWTVLNLSNIYIQGKLTTWSMTSNETLG